MLLGCIADDFTGATDIGLTLSRAGMRVVLTIGLPDPGRPLPGADAVVVALKTRTAPVDEAVRQACAACDVLTAAGARQIVFKYCSTFDSTDTGNIGPVTEALMARLSVELTVACPAFPGTGRTVYQGHLFVGADLLSDSPMRHHPLTPMTDSSLVRLLSRQTALPVGLVPLNVVEAGADALASAFDAARRRGDRILVADALSDAHLAAIGRAAKGLRLLTGASGIAIGLPENFRGTGLPEAPGAGADWQAGRGRAAILAGSCSLSTRRQVAAATAAGIPAFRLSPQALADGRQSPQAVLAWIGEQPPQSPILVHSTCEPDEVKAAQQTLGIAEAAICVERALASLASALLDRGFARFVVAGGETSGAVVAALGVRTLAIGPEIDPGVPWTRTLDGPDVTLALKSGNFGAEDFFTRTAG